MDLLEKSLRRPARRALIDARGDCSYGDLADGARRIALLLLDGRRDLSEARIAFLAPAGRDYVAVLWGIWMAGGIAVPLCTAHPAPEQDFVLSDTHPEALVLHSDFASRSELARRRGIRVVNPLEGCADEGSLPQPGPERSALILYTSGTTGRPKGAVLTHANLAAQSAILIEAWEWTEDDRILHVLPLHHTHGLVNALLCPLSAGSTCEFLGDFDPQRAWQRFESCEVSVFMAVPTIYLRLISAWEQADEHQKKRMSQAAAGLRLAVSGSAALPVSAFEAWKRISRKPLLERYGMTEIGMALSNPYRGERRAGFVGQPLPHVEIRLVDDQGRQICEEGQAGGIQVKGPSVFREYWERPRETRQAFEDGWFITGDVAVLERGSYRILGRSSIDIIKTGGYKVSAFEVEEALRSHPAVKECAVVGVEDPEWGERVSAAIICRSGEDLSLEALRDWAKPRLALYKIPSRLRIVGDLPRNVMGKVTKIRVRELFEA